MGGTTTCDQQLAGCYCISSNLVCCDCTRCNLTCCDCVGSNLCRSYSTIYNQVCIRAFLDSQSRPEEGSSSNGLSDNIHPALQRPSRCSERALQFRPRSCQQRIACYSNQVCRPGAIILIEICHHV
ncbi:pentapeptide repeat-containing protein [Leptothrix discophora]|uniref:pentapeptide repeat-containing protein n=1 Tax=Leptothrix discophora TaxID=89 RepID=UPI0034E5AC6F